MLGAGTENRSATVTRFCKASTKSKHRLNCPSQSRMASNTLRIGFAPRCAHERAKAVAQDFVFIGYKEEVRFGYQHSQQYQPELTCTDFDDQMRLQFKVTLNRIF